MLPASWRRSYTARPSRLKQKPESPEQVPKTRKPDPKARAGEGAQGSKGASKGDVYDAEFHAKGDNKDEKSDEPWG